MSSRRVLYFSVLCVLLFVPFFARADSERVLWDKTRVDPAWQVVALDARTTLEQKDGSAVLKSAGESYLVYRAQLRSREFDRLALELRSNTPLRIELIPNVSTTGKYTFELRKQIGDSEAFETVTFSLKHSWFTKPLVSIPRSAITIKRRNDDVYQEHIYYYDRYPSVGNR